MAGKSRSGARQALANGTALLDQVNLRLLELLQQDPRLTMAELARRVGMSAPAVTERVQRLESTGVIAGYRMDLDPAALGLPICAYVRVRPGPPCSSRGSSRARRCYTPGDRVPPDHRGRLLPAEGPGRGGRSAGDHPGSLSFLRPDHHLDRAVLARAASIASPGSLMRILVGVASRGAPELLRALDPLVSVSGQEWSWFTCWTTGAREEMELAGGRLRSRPIPRHRLREIAEAERQAARAALDEAVEVALALGALPETLIEEGEPGRILCRRIEERDCDLGRGGARRRPKRDQAGPKSVGHTARFVLDHSPRPVQLHPDGSPPADRPGQRTWRLASSWNCPD